MILKSVGQKHTWLSYAVDAERTVLYIVHFSQETDGNGRPKVHLDLYSHRQSRRIPDWIIRAIDRLVIPEPVLALVQEIYAALHQQLFVLASMGSRSLIEQIMKDKVGDQGPFAQTLKKFISEGYMGLQQKIQLEAALEMGHATIHRGFAPIRTELETVLDIAEGLIASVYVHPRNTFSLHERIPPRERLAPAGKRRAKIEPS